MAMSPKEGRMIDIRDCIGKIRWGLETESRAAFT